MQQGRSEWVPNVIAWIVRRANWVFFAAVLAFTAAVLWAAPRLQFDTDPANMLAADLPFRKSQAELSAQIAGTDPGIIILIRGRSAAQADALQAQLTASLTPQTKRFSKVEAWELSPFFRRNGWLYLSTDQLDDLSLQVLAAQPFFGALSQDLSLTGVAKLLERALDAPQAEGIDLVAPLNALNAAATAATGGRHQTVDWVQVAGIGAVGPRDKLRVVEVYPHMDYAALQPAQAAMRAVQDAIARLPAAEVADAQISVTGMVAMEHEEIGEAFGGGVMAFACALLIIIPLLLWGLRDWRLARAVLLTLLWGLGMAAAFAAAVAPKLNLISVAFGVLYLGLGVNYPLYVAVRFRELRLSGAEHDDAIVQSVGGSLRYLLVCALTTACGFLAFVPTDFVGVASLGLIAAGGMLISLFATVTVFAALLKRVPDRGVAEHLSRLGQSDLRDVPYRFARPLSWAALVLALGAAVLAPKLRFDFDPLSLRNPNSDAVKSFRQLQASGELPVLSVSALAANDAEAARLAAQLEKLPQVGEVITPARLVPSHQAEKLALLADLRLAMGNVLSDAVPTWQPSTPRDAASLDRLLDALDRAAQHPRHGKAAVQARKALAALQHSPQASAAREVLAENLLAGLPPLLQQLRESVQAREVTEADLPRDFIARWRAKDGRPRVEVVAKAGTVSNAQLVDFVRAVRGPLPGAAGGPIELLEAGQAVVGAFTSALIAAGIAITLVCLLATRSLVQTGLVLGPMLLAALYIVALMVLIDLPFNFANIIGVPLLLGVGVDYSVYLVQQAQRLPAGSNLLRSGASRAVLLGALLTLASFGNLMWAQHPGLVSMGLLLAVGLTIILVCTLVLLPGWLLRQGNA